MTEQELEKFEGDVTQTARGFVYPRTPVLRRAAVGALRATLPRRLVLAVLVAVLALSAALLSIPSVRAVVLRFLQIGVVQIEVAQPTPTPASSPRPTHTPTPAAQPLAAQLNLFGKTTLTQARANGIRIKVPVALGEPDAVYFQDLGGSAAILIWFDEATPGTKPGTKSNKVRISLQVFTNDVFARKSPPTVLSKTTVKGKNAAWVQGKHILKVRSGNYEAVQLVSANALIWTEDSYTYRLEADLTLAEAVKIAETTP